MKSLRRFLAGMAALAATLCFGHASLPPGGPVYLTNIVTTMTSNLGVRVTFDLAGGTNFVWYGVCGATNLAHPQWVWLTNTFTGTHVSLTNQPGMSAFYTLCPPVPSTVVAWGDTNSGQCDVPAGLTNVVAVSGGFNFSVALKADGTVTAWGDNTYGETNVPAGLSNIVAIAAGGAQVLALRENGTVAAWGDNDNGQTSVPASLTNVTAIAAGNACGFALRQDGTVAAWGYNAYGQTSVPALPSVTQVAAGAAQGVALLTNSTVAIWSSSDYSGYPFYWNLLDIPKGLTNVIAIAAGGYHTLALGANGLVTAWGAGGTNYSGYNDFGQSLVPAGLSNVVAIAGGQLYSMALRADGTVVEWGDQAYNALDQPAGLGGVRMISAGGFHGLAITYPTAMPLIVVPPKAGGF